MKNILTILVLLVTSQLVGQEPVVVDNNIRFDPAVVFDEISELVREHFFRPDFNADNWKRVAKPFRDRCLAAVTHDEYAATINKLLKTLNASHTYYFSKLNPKRFQLLGVFHSLFPDRPAAFFQYDGIGIDTTRVAGIDHVCSTYDGLPAHQSGLRYGDQILSVDNRPFHPIISFDGKTSCNLKIRRAGEEKELKVLVKELDGRNMFEQAMNASASIIERNGKSIGYIHAWCYAGLKYQEILRDHILWGKLKDCDSLILDIRDGWGGADINYLNLFRPPIADVESSSRNADRQSYTGVWGKPVTLLINERSTSGKELFAFGFKKLQLGKVVGETSAGAVVAGRCFLLSNDDVLYLAVRDVKVDGRRLEHVGVGPDIKIDRPLSDSSEKDPQVEKALEVLSR